jgi:hypothetical protein
MRKLLFTSLAATTLIAAWSSCFVAKGKAATTTGTTSTSGTGGAGGTEPATTSSTTATTSGAGGQPGFGGASGFGGGVPVIDVVCNPVTNDNCSGGKACEPAVNGGLAGFACATGQNTQTVCANCDPFMQSPPFCAPDLICLPTNAEGTLAQCAHYCCTDADCGPAGTCSVNGSNGPRFTPVSTTLGICVSNLSLFDAGAGDGGDAGDAGNLAATMPFACDPPVVPPSGGSCVTLTL